MSVFNDIKSIGNITVKGNLLVEGTTTSVDAENLNIADSHILLNKNSTVNRSGGIVVNYDTIGSGVNTTAFGTSTVSATGLVLSAGDYIQVSGSLFAENDGLYQVLTYVDPLITLDLSPSNNFIQSNTLVAGADTVATVNRVLISVIDTDPSNGSWRAGKGSSAGNFTYTDNISTNTSDIANLESKTQNIDLANTVANTTQLNGNLDMVSGNIRLEGTTDLIFGTGTQNSFISATTNATDEKRVRFQNSSQIPNFEICQPNAPDTIASPCSILTLNKNTGGLGGVNLNYFHNGTDISVPNAGARLNHLCFTMTGSPCEFSFFEDQSMRAGNLHYDQGDKAGVDNNGLKILDTTASTSISSGAIQCSGGVGIAGDVFIGGDLDVAGSIINSTESVEVIPDDTATITLSKQKTIIKDGGKKSLPNYVGVENNSKIITVPSRWDVITDSANGPVHAIFADGNDVYFGGDFTIIGGISANRIAMWDGNTWTAFSTGFNNIVWDIKKFGGDIYACGEFNSPTQKIAMWDGAAWQPLGSGLNSTGYSMTEFNSELVVAGDFETANGITVNYIASWNGSVWSDLNGGFDGDVYNIKVVGSDLYVGGSFSNNTAAIPVPVNNVASWNGSVWSALASGISGSFVTAIEADGTDIYFGGDFTTADPSGLNISTNSIALWNGSSWSALSGGVGAGNVINWITLIGTDIVVAGEITSADGDLTGNVAKWNGSSWSSVDEGVAYTTSNIAVIYRIEITPYGNMIGGDFNLAGGERISNCCFYSNVDKTTITFNSDADSILIYPGDTIEFNSTTQGSGYKWYISPQSTAYDELGIITNKIKFAPLLDPKILLEGDMFYHNIDKKVKIFDNTSVKSLAYSSDLTGLESKTQNIDLANTIAGETHINDKLFVGGELITEDPEIHLGLNVYANNASASEVVLIGRDAGSAGTSDAVVAIGTRACKSGAGTLSTTLGRFAGELAPPGIGSVVVGNSASRQTSSGVCSVVVGCEANDGVAITNGQKYVCIGNQAGRDGVGDGSIVIGDNANAGTGSVAIGLEACKLGQGIGSVAIGTNACSLSAQGASSVAIGNLSARTNQGANAVAIGALSAQTNQDAKTIVLNADTSGLDTTQENEIRMKAGLSTLDLNQTSGLVVNGQNFTTKISDLESKTQNIDLAGTVANTTQINGGLKFNPTSTVELKRRTDTDLRLQGQTFSTFTVETPDAVGIRSVVALRSGGDGVFMQYQKLGNTDPGNNLCIAHQGSPCDAQFFRDGSVYLGADFEYNEANHDGKEDGVHIQSSTSSTSTTTGALKVAGGVGIVENVNIGGNLVVLGNKDGFFQTVGNQINFPTAGSGAYISAVSTGVGSLSVPANRFNQTTVWKLEFGGFMPNSTRVMSMRIRINLTTVAQILNATTVTTPGGGNAWSAQAVMTFRTVGATSDIHVQHFLKYVNLTNSQGSLFTPGSVDTTSGVTFDIQVASSEATGSIFLNSCVLTKLI